MATEIPAPGTFEKLGVFYLGRRYDLEAGESLPELLLYDSRDLTTHAVCVGMTGSGKTGLCVGLLEEAAIDGIPALVVDPKGDLTNLLLTFPDLAPADFEPWVSDDDAARKGISREELGTAQAKLWRDGLASWGQDGERIRRLRAAADFRVYTPGSSAGEPISIVSSFAAPPAAVVEDGDLLRDRVSGTATSLLGLLGVDADPLQSREHILLSTLLDHAWREGRSLDLGSLIHGIQEPPVKRVGVLDLESFYPSKERFGLALRLNNLLAAPGFGAWMEGTPLDVGQLLYTAEGRPRVAVLSIAHLSESERMFFVSLLLHQTLAWMRSRPGTTSLRALLYMDEVFGYMPPIGEPPSKKPLLTLLKQARAFGLGVVLATQNPVDLDYKGLSNTGTWFLGRLQTERDKMRVLDGLEGASGSGFDRQSMDRLLSRLGKRVFLCHNVHEREPVVFETRWVMSYLRGPLTRNQIRRLSDSTEAATAQALDPGAAPGAVAAESVPAPPPGAARPMSRQPVSRQRVSRQRVSTQPVSSRPVIGPEIRELFIPDPRPGEVAYRPAPLGVGRVQFVDSRTKETLAREEVVLAGTFDTPLPGDVDWAQARRLDLGADELEPDPVAGASFDELPESATDARAYRRWEKALSDALYRGRSLDLYRSPSLHVRSAPGEDERDFRIRLADAAREERDRQKAELRSKFESKVDRLEERIRTARQALTKEEEQARQQKLNTVISVGATVLSAFLGRSAYRGTTTAARGVTRSLKEGQDIARAQETVDVRVAELEELERELTAELEAVEERIDPLTEELEVESVRPRRSDVEVLAVMLGWLPQGR